MGNLPYSARNKDMGWEHEYPPPLIFYFFLREGADAVDFRTQAKIKIYSFNSKDPSF